MMRYYRKISSFLVLISCIILFSCSRVSQENFNRLNQNMTMQEVIQILGEPTSSESVDIAGISGTASIWRSDKAEINIQFLNNKLLMKSYVKKDGKDGKDEHSEQQ